VKDQVFVVGGGPSLKDFNFERLRYKDTIAVNVSALDVPDPNYCITADSGMFKKVQEGVFANIKTCWVGVTNPNHCTMQYKDGVFRNTKTGFVYNLFAFDVIIKNNGVEGFGFSFDDFKTGYNSGFCALQLAYLLGYAKIYLLGIDLQTGDHYHERYNGRIQKTCIDLFYKSFVEALQIIKEKTDTQVFSCSSISRLNNIIPYVSFGEV